MIVKASVAQVGAVPFDVQASVSKAEDWIAKAGADRTALFFGPDRTLLGKHRKLMPTAGERLIWGFGDGSTMLVFETPIGNIGAVICCDNYMPMLRMAMYAKGISICCAPNADDADAMLRRGGFAILGPPENVLAGPLCGEETLLSAEVDLDALARAKLDFDVTGHYAHPDVLSMKPPSRRSH